MRHASRRRTFAIVVSALALTAAGTTVRALVHTPNASATSTAGGLAVYVGYAEDKEFLTPDPASFPTPWAGAPNTLFLGGPVPGGTTACGAIAVCYDAGAIRLDNPSTSAITVDRVTVDDHSSVTGGKLFSNLWGSFTIAAGQSAILTENPPASNPSYDNFDTSSYPSTCTPVTVPPTVAVTIAGATTILTDSGHVLDTGGIDVGSCSPAHNESLAWRPIGAQGGSEATVTLGPATQTVFAGSTAVETATVSDASGLGLPNVVVNFSVTSGPDGGFQRQAVTDANGRATLNLTATGEGEDVISASVTTVGTFIANTVRVLWSDANTQGWTSADIGGATPPGTTSFSLPSGTITLQGGGAGFTGTTDQFRSTWKSVTGDGGVAARVGSPSGSSSPVAGVLLRTDTTAGSPYYAAVVAPDGTITVRERSLAGAHDKTVVSVPSSGPAYVWIDNRAGFLTTYSSTDGYYWVAVAGSRVATVFGAQTLAGLAVTSADPGSTAQAVFGPVVVSATAPAPLPVVSCPDEWTCADVGDPSPPGGQSYDSGTATWTVTAGGADISGTADQFHFAAQAMTGDGSVTARVVSQTNTSAYAKAGVMLRVSTDPGAPNYAVLVSPGSGVKVQVRTTQGATTTKLANPSGVAPIWLRATRAGNTFSAYVSSDGAAWSLLAGSQITMPLPSVLLGGMAATSHNTSALGTVVFDHVSPPVPLSAVIGTTTSTTTRTTTSTTAPSTVSTTTTTAAATTTTTPTTTTTTTSSSAVGCGAGWTGADIGNPTPSGSDSCDASTGTRTVVAGGADITGSADQFRYVWGTASANATLTAHVASQTNTSSNAKAGPMFRATSAADAPNYAVLVSPGAGIKVQVRQVAGGTTTKLANPPGTTPAWLRITRSGNTFTAYTSSDGIAWVLIPGSSITLALPSTMLEGIAATSHNSQALSTVVFDAIFEN